RGEGRRPWYCLRAWNVSEDGPGRAGEWLYVDRSGAEFGPFPTGKMRAWFAHGFFPIGKDLLVRMTHWPATTRVPVRDLYPDPEPLADVVVPPALRPRNLGTSL
ncbi:unnamed protein product, partial [Prorocentrum cordatum]